MSPGTISPLANVKALGFDVFGTVVDWRSSVIEELTLRAHRKCSTDLTPSLRSRLESLSDDDWGRFAQEWRNSYGQFTRNFNPDQHEWKNIDDHHRDSLVELLGQWSLNGLFSDSEIDSLSLVWHRLTPWPDSSEGLHALGERFVTGTLSNGNVTLLQDLNDFGNLGFQKILSAEMFGAYKPHPNVYRGAAQALGFPTEEVALVAAHLGDLAGARACGLRTIYVERADEESWKKDDEKYNEAKSWVDLWVSEHDDGFVTVAKKLSEFAS